MKLILQPLTTLWKNMQISILNYHVWLLTYKKKVGGVLDYFISFLKNMEKINLIIWFLWCRTLGLKPFILCLHLLVMNKAIVQEYDRKSLFPMLFKCPYHLHPLVQSERGVVDQKVEEDSSLDIFEMINNTIELTTKRTYKKLLIFRHHQSKASNVHFNGEKIMRICFL